ncbi:integrase protein-related [Anaeramoeba flamelloides]|uniref:Integrase protein-related n=1 Tax=Anaeramoeba flamelloides TaxID=1746091 RepID=A0AAV7ZRW4_9EUKA|nr:integrase protein-related [Anaeramoeba flamelloides]
MFADDLILIMKGSMIEINYQLQKIYKIIKDFGMNPNDDKTKKNLIPKEKLYLGIWLDKKTHLKFNFEKVNNNFEKILHIFKERNFSNGLKIQFFKAVLHSQLLYGLEIFDFTESDFKKIDLDIIEDLDHFLWNCPAYENNRKIWISELEKNNFSLILNNNNIYNTINKQDSISLLALVDNKTIYLNGNFEVRLHYLETISRALRLLGKENIFVMDETGFHRNKRENGWSLVGERSSTTEKGVRRLEWDMFAMINTHGIVCTHLINHNACGIDHAEFLLYKALPIIRNLPNSVIVMDNHPIHTTYEQDLSDCFEEFGCHIINMPVYSPDLNPIEEVFGVLKHLMKNYKNCWDKSPTKSILRSVLDFNLNNNCENFINKIFLT